MSVSSDYFFYADVNYVDTSNVLSNYMNLTHNTNNSLDLSENILSKYARGIFFSPNYNKQFFDAINWANSLGDYKTQLNLINPYNDNVLTNVDDAISAQFIISNYIEMNHINGSGGYFGGWGLSSNSDGTIVAISSPFTNGHRGSVRVYKYDNEDWNQIGSTINGVDSEDRTGQSISLNADGNILAIGIPRDHGPNNNLSRIGKVLIYDYVETRNPQWKQLGNYISGNQEYEDSGCSVSLNADGTIIAIGAFANTNINGEHAGCVRVYDYVQGRSPKEWDQLGNDMLGETGNNRLGQSVSLSADGTIVAAGAIYNNGSRGHVRVYDYDQTRTPAWNQLGDDIDGEAAEDHSGWSISLSDDGTILAIGAIYNDGNGPNSGHTRVYDYVEGRSPKEWDQLGTDIDGEDAGDAFGHSVSLNADGTILAIGSPYNNNYNGHARVYQYIDNEWDKVIDDIDGTGNFGARVSLNKTGSILFVGAPDDNSGRVYTYKLVDDNN